MLHASHRTTAPSVTWDDPAHATIRIGAFQAKVIFYGAAHDDNVFARFWVCDPPRQAGPTGLFGRIHASLQFITEAFLGMAQPTALIVRGIDAKRNTWNARTYGGFCAPGYRFYRLLQPAARCASAEGVVAVGWVRQARAAERAVLDALADGARWHLAP